MLFIKAHKHNHMKFAMEMCHPFSSNGGWVLDNFPFNREQWTFLLERGNIVPDDIICLKDDSNNGDFLIKRWYQTKRDEVDEKIRVRKENEEAERLRAEEEARSVYQLSSLIALVFGELFVLSCIAIFQFIC